MYLSAHFLVRFPVIVTLSIHKFGQITMFLRKQFKTCCDLEKISRSPDARNLVCARVIHSLNSVDCSLFQIYWQK